MYKLTLPDVTKQYSGIWDLICYNSQGLIVKSCQLFVVGVSNDHLNSDNKTKMNETIINIKPSFNKLQASCASNSKQEPINKSPEIHSNLIETKITLMQNSKLEPPEFETMFTDKVMHAGETVCLRCTLKGNPSPTVQWRFNGKVLNLPTERILMVQNKNEYALFIYNACDNDTGRYEVTAENVVGKATCSALLIINCAIKSR